MSRTWVPAPWHQTERHSVNPSPPRPRPFPYPSPDLVRRYPAHDDLAERSGAYPLPEYEPDTLFPGVCRNGVCTTFHCLCEVDADLVRHFAAWVIGLHPMLGTGRCGCGLEQTRCPHLAAVRDMADTVNVASMAIR